MLSKFSAAPRRGQREARRVKRRRIWALALAGIALAGAAVFLALRRSSAAQPQYDAATLAELERDAFPYQPIPASYAAAAHRPGTLEDFSYPVSAGGETARHRACVYLPWGYGDSKNTARYRVLYLMHGAGGSEHTYLGTPEEPSGLKLLLDHLIEDGKIAPLIVVTPTVDAGGGLADFSRELTDALLPAAESTYRTFAVTADRAGLRASRDSRAFGGFSMGGLLTWEAFSHCLDCFATYIPMSCPSYWPVSEDSQKEAAQSAAAAQALVRAAEDSGYSPRDYRIFAASGGEDFLCKPLHDQVMAMGAQGGPFLYSARGFSGGNLTFCMVPGQRHSFRDSFVYLYNALLQCFPA
jgi:enterochelin esterase-like enzyme